MKYIYCCFYVVPKNRIFIEKYILIYEPLLSFYATILKIVLVQDTHKCSEYRSNDRMR